MIVKCTTDDLDLIKQYIGDNYASCLYLYMDLIQYGPDSVYTKTWIQKQEGRISCVILAYHTAMHIYAHDEFNVQELVELVREQKPSQICALKSTIQALQSPLLELDYEVELGYVGKMSFSGDEVSGLVQRATLDDVDRISRLLYQDEGIGASYTLEDLKEQFTERLSQGFVRSFIIKDEGEIVAHLGTGAEVGNVSIVTYVITDNRYRRRGFARLLYQAACRELQQEGKEVYAVYYVPSAIQLHHSMGFVDCCEVGKLFLKTH